MWCALIIFFVCMYIKIQTINLPTAKYFNESPTTIHLDIRYNEQKKHLTLAEIKDRLTALLKALNEMIHGDDIRVVLMHGGLIGYFFNKQLLPWDDDVDVIVIGNDIHKIVQKHNWETNEFKFEVNPNYANINTADTLNKIDARLICKMTGVFIDFTFFWKDEYSNTYFAKDGHVYESDDLFPLVYDSINNIPIHVPNNIEVCLIKEYGFDVLIPKYKSWIFDGVVWKKVKQ